MDLRPEDFHMPAEWEPHEGTWIAWPHDKFKKGYMVKLERIWMEITMALQPHENVHIIVYDEIHREHVEHQLKYIGNGLGNIDFYIVPTNSIWICDNGPLVVVNKNGKEAIVDWEFNGWGDRYPYELDNQVPAILSSKLDIPRFDAPVVLESGHEVNGKGAFMATRSSIINPNRNPGKTEAEIEKELSRYIGVNNFIWLSGVDGNDPELGPEETDCHVDLCVRFTGEDTIAYGWAGEIDNNDPFYKRVLKVHLEELKNARTDNDKPFNLVKVPMNRHPMYSTSHIGTVGHITETRRARLAACGPNSWYCPYLDWHVANNIILVPIYGDENDDRATGIIRELFPEREVIGIECRSLLEGGGIIHCVTKEQPAVRHS
jgi:agmatine deiminase